MAKADTIDALMESAIDAFSRYGYEGASLRDIAGQAGVPLSTIHMYFGSKSELYNAVELKAWAEIDRERSALLRAALDKTPGRPAALEDLIHALALPVVRRALSASTNDIALVHLVRCRLTGSGLRDADRLLEIADRSIVRWINAMVPIFPTLSRQDIIWAFSFCVGAMYSWQLIDHRYDKMIGEDSARTVEGVTADIVAFGCAGVRAMVQRRTAESAPARARAVSAARA